MSFSSAVIIYVNAIGIVHLQKLNFSKNSIRATVNVLNYLRFLKSVVTVLREENADILVSQQGANIIIPDIYTSISEDAFEERELKSIVIPDSVKTIGNYAFIFNELTSIDLGNGVTSIGIQAFAGNELTSVDIPNSVVSIGKYAFEDNYLSSVNIGKGVITINDDAFNDNLLSEIDIPEGVEYIGEDAFANNNLEKIFIPDTVLYIGEDAFEDNPLKEVNIPSQASFDPSVFPAGVEIIRRNSSINESDSTIQDIVINDLPISDEVKTFNLAKLVSVGYGAVGTIIIGTDGKDKITGTSIGEILSGGKGKDVLKGGGGGDGFLFQDQMEFGKKRMDKIKDFDYDEGDSILISREVFGLSIRTDYINIETVSGKKSRKKAERSDIDFVYDDKKGFIYFNENGAEVGWGSGGLFASLKGSPYIDADYFTIV